MPLIMTIPLTINISFEYDVEDESGEITIGQVFVDNTDGRDIREGLDDETVERLKTLVYDHLQANH